MQKVATGACVTIQVEKYIADIAESGIRMCLP